jgi:hypothetical protein
MLSIVVDTVSKPQTLVTALFACITWVTTNGIYNWYFHPLSKFPGPKWAAFSVWWKVNLELIQGKNLVDELFKLHDTYGELSQSISGTNSI